MENFFAQPGDEQATNLVRSTEEGHGPSGALQVGTLRLDFATFDAYAGRRRVSLTRIEFDLLAFLMRNARRVVSQAELVEEVIGGTHARNSSLIRVHMTHLRRKLGAESAAIRTVRGRGFMLQEPTVAAAHEPRPLPRSDRSGGPARQRSVER